MSSLVNKRILVGVTGGIAAYKSADLVRRLREAGAEVRVVMTDAATEFITELTLQAVSGYPVHRKLLDPEAEAGMSHIELARWADAVLVAPATADFLARLVQGRGDDLLATLCLATSAPMAVAPAMNQQMWRHPATQQNVDSLRRRGVQIFGPGEGSQACGDVGPGRLLEPAELVQLTSGLFQTGVLNGVTVMVTAGPTWEAIDPVRGLTNKSSGKMGYAIATAAAEAGARVILISGPVSLAPPDRVETVPVVSAQDMFDAVHARIDQIDLFIGVAAVADYRPVSVASHKLKKSADSMNLELVRNPDILASVAALPSAPFTVGFAAETNDLEMSARHKLEAKRIDLVCANLVGGDEGGFGADENRLLLVDREGTTELPLAAKSRLARDLIHHISRKFHAKNRTQDTRRAHRR
jgi:phosphopantothenoylcysteine decarboxylase/phosphopantothenate--cysteine ligase